MDLSNIAERNETSINEELPAEEIEKRYRDYLAVKEKVDSGQEATLDDVRVIVLYNRSIREAHYRIVKTKPKKLKRADILAMIQENAIPDEHAEEVQKFIENYKPKKLSRANLLLALAEKQAGTVPGDLAEADISHSIALYKGKKLKPLDLGLLMRKKTENEFGLNAVELRDYNLTVYGDADYEGD